jgi:hypothetical protein
LSLGRLPNKTTTKKPTKKPTTAVQRLAHSEDITSESRLKKGGEGSIAGRTNQKDGGPHLAVNKGRALQQLSWSEGSDFVGLI